jgi:hypothetical protein
MALAQGISIVDISVIHPLSLNTISQAATTAGAAASQRDQQKRTAFVNGALRELSVGLCRGKFFAYRASVGMLARCSGASFRAGMRVPTDECVE